MTDAAMPEKLEGIVKMFKSLPRNMRLQALLEYSRKLPELPAEYRDHPERMEQVPECVSPFFLATEVEDGHVRMYFDVPAEAPTVRGFAGILTEGLRGESPQHVLNVPDTFYFDMGLQELITPNRLNGMHAILRRLKNQVQAHA
ncbi:SufE family protein [Deinococcus pimensis]|uniref:SufE family protein n=1 Tax=Deinococcus pimensis TaxID=309888 RepID=UPI000483789A|nr:SufE family protein [Deinococcus pimensis]